MSEALSSTEAGEVLFQPAAFGAGEIELVVVGAVVSGAGLPWHCVVPESVKDDPAIGANFQS